MRLKIHFIIKISNSKITKRIKEQVRIKFDENKYQVKISQSSFKGETKTFAREAVLNKTDLIVACGGDGTINEILNEIKEKEFKIAIVPIGSGNGIARHFNIPLDIMTITIAAITIGIAVDNTIHYLYRFREFNKKHKLMDSIKLTNSSAGLAVLTTSITIALGFSVLSFSSFIPTILFGIFTSMAMIFAMLGVIILIPSLLIFAKYD